MSSDSGRKREGRKSGKETLYDDLGFVLRGRQRRAVLRVMSRPMVPSQISRSIRGEYRISLNNVSRVLRDLERKGLVECANPHKATGRVYLLTDRGKRVREELVSQSD